MAIEFYCPGCDVFLCVGDDKAGLAAECPHCEVPLVVPRRSQIKRAPEPADHEIEDYDAPPARHAYAPPVEREIRYVHRPSSGLATTSLVLGTIGLVTFCVACVTIPCSVLALIFGGIAVVQTRSGRVHGRSSAVAGIVCGLLALTLNLLMLAQIVGALQRFNKPKVHINHPDMRRR